MSTIVKIVWAALLGLVSLTSYPAVIHGFIIRYRTAAKRVKLEPFGSNAVIIYPCIAGGLALAGGYSLYSFTSDKDWLHLVVMAAELLAALLFLIMWLSRDNIYLTQTHIIMPDSARNAKQCSYRIKDDKLEFTFISKVSKREQMFRVAGDIKLAKQMLEGYECAGELVFPKDSYTDADDEE